MDALFLRLLNMSITAGWLVLAVVILRFVLKKAPKFVHCILWIFVGIRLVLPFSFESALSLIPSAQTVDPDILHAKAPVIHSGISVLNQAVNPVISKTMPLPGNDANPLKAVLGIATAVWIVGMAAMLLYGLISYVRLRRRVAEAVPMKDNLWQSEAVLSPFVLGLLRPRIYLPFNLNEAGMAHVIAHEQAHIKRRDHWIKLLGFLILTLYWFNPLIGLAYILLCRDIELACDEHVIKGLSTDQRRSYSKALLSCSVGRGAIAACPLAFGEVGVKQRIRSVLNYKKPAFWIVLVGLISCLVVTVCFLTNPKENEDPAKVVGEYDTGRLGGTFVNSDNPAYEIGMNAYGMPVFVNIDAAFTAIIQDCAEGFDYLSNEFDLPPVSKNNYERYKTYGWQTGATDKAVQNQCIEISQFFDIYENSYSTNRPADIPPTMPGDGVYISKSCLYMNPFSSYYPVNGDSGYRYLVGRNSFAIVSKRTGETHQSFTDIQWNWQELSQDQWKEMFPIALTVPDIGTYEKAMMLELSDRFYLFQLDGTLWIGDYNSDKVGMWSIYELMPCEDTTVTWEYTPLLSSRYPAFPFLFNLSYTRLEAACSAGSLIGFDDHDGTSYPMGKSLTLPEGSRLYWSPQSGDEYSDAYALSAEVIFTVYDGDALLYSGIVSIACKDGIDDNGNAAYTAALLDCNGLYMQQDTSQDGALLTETPSSP